LGRLEFKRAMNLTFLSVGSSTARITLLTVL